MAINVTIKPNRPVNKWPCVLQARDNSCVFAFAFHHERLEQCGLHYHVIRLDGEDVISYSDEKAMLSDWYVVSDTLCIEGQVL